MPLRVCCVLGSTGSSYRPHAWTCVVDGGGSEMKLHVVMTAVMALALGGAAQAAPKESYLRPEAVPAPANNQLPPERVELGKALFFDPRRSGSFWISCATCHIPGLGWSDGLPTAIGHGMKALGRATPTILNTAYQRKQRGGGRGAARERRA